MPTNLKDAQSHRTRAGWQWSDRVQRPHLHYIRLFTRTWQTARQPFACNKLGNIFITHLVMYYCYIYSKSTAGIEYTLVFNHWNCVGQMYETFWIQWMYMDCSISLAEAILPVHITKVIVCSPSHFLTLHERQTRRAIHFRLLQPWGWKSHNPSKLCEPHTKWRGVTFQKNGFLKYNQIGYSTYPLS
jgi:hypothetical protein